MRVTRWAIMGPVTVAILVVRVPKHCPPGDERGKVYCTTNLRNHEHWTLPDSEHACGGA